MSHELNNPPPGGWPVGSLCVVTHDPSGAVPLVELEVLAPAEAAWPETVEQWARCQGRRIEPGMHLQRCRAGGYPCDGYWPSAWMRPISNPDEDAECHHETEKKDELA